MQRNMRVYLLVQFVKAITNASVVLNNLPKSASFVQSKKTSDRTHFIFLIVDEMKSNRCRNGVENFSLHDMLWRWHYDYIFFGLTAKCQNHRILSNNTVERLLVYVCVCVNESIFMETVERFVIQCTVVVTTTHLTIFSEQWTWFCRMHAYLAAWTNLPFIYTPFRLRNSFQFTRTRKLYNQISFDFGGAYEQISKTKWIAGSQNYSSS